MFHNTVLNNHDFSPFSEFSSPPLKSPQPFFTRLLPKWVLAFCWDFMLFPSLSPLLTPFPVYMLIFPGLRMLYSCVFLTVSALPRPFPRLSNSNLPQMRGLPWPLFRLPTPLSRPVVTPAFYCTFVRFYRPPEVSFPEFITPWPSRRFSLPPPYSSVRTPPPLPSPLQPSHFFTLCPVFKR